MAFQLCTRDEYGSTSILKTGENTTDLLKDARKLTTEDNMNNALALDEKKKDWTSFVVEFFDEEDNQIDNAVYAGRTGAGKHRIYLMDGNEIKKEYLLNDVEVNMKFFIGELIIDRKKGIQEDVYAEKPMPKKPGQTVFVTDFEDMLMEGKTSYYVVKSR